jgi:hypothetical protein
VNRSEYDKQLLHANEHAVHRAMDIAVKRLKCREEKVSSSRMSLKLGQTRLSGELRQRSWQL